MDRRYQVFISSTFTDLIEERKEVIQALLELDCLPAGMEMFPAASDDQWTLIKKVIDQSDFYVVVVGGRYGSMSAEGISYTEMEYDYAVEHGKTVLGFAHANPGSIPADKSELIPAARQRLDAFRAKVETRHVKYYNNAEDLGGKVSRALSLAMRGTTAEGWIRGEFAMTPERQAEFAELRALVSQLRLELESKVAAESRIPDDLASGDDVFELDLVLVYTTQADVLIRQNDPWVTIEEKSVEVKLPTTWNEIFAAIGPALFEESTQSSVVALFTNRLERMLQNKTSELLPAGAFLTSVRIAPECSETFFLQLFALGLIQHGTRQRGVSDRNKYWKLSELGQDVLMKVRAIKKPVASMIGE